MVAATEDQNLVQTKTELFNAIQFLCIILRTNWLIFYHAIQTLYILILLENYLLKS